MWRPAHNHRVQRPECLVSSAKFTRLAMAFHSSLAPFPFAPPPGAFHRVHLPAGASRVGAPGRRLVSYSSPSPDVVVTREHGKNGKLVTALVSSLSMVVVLALFFWIKRNGFSGELGGLELEGLIYVSLNIWWI